ncbi:nucleotidyl transferase AbiEii/AbiGii toxin family protein [Nocardia sp. No.11]|uniref:nucleotidyl transferase AbiEii/AbiGii toxin family protein n=1 Tax=Nocardia sp. No.11 TaxID=3128861 RepID=UPI00319E61FA
MTRSPDAVRRSVTDHLKAHAKATEQDHNTVKRRFVMSRFLVRVFTADPDRWILKGGVGMMVRLPESRYSRDIDLLTVPQDRDSDPITQLRIAVRDNHLDQFRFELSEPLPLSNGKGSTVTVRALLGGKQFDAFSIDIVDARRELIGAIEHQPAPRLIDNDDFPGQARIALYPLADQIADKICACFERFGAGGTSSGRYRDLVDLLLVSMYLPIDLETTVAAVEAERAMRRIPSLPRTMQAPGPDWAVQWSKTAKKSPLAAEHHDLEAALATARTCYDRILISVPAAATPHRWSPERRIWAPSQ